MENVQSTKPSGDLRWKRKKDTVKTRDAKKLKLLSSCKKLVFSMLQGINTGFVQNTSQQLSWLSNCLISLASNLSHWVTLVWNQTGFLKLRFVHYHVSNEMTLWVDILSSFSLLWFPSWVSWSKSIAVYNFQTIVYKQCHDLTERVPYAEFSLMTLSFQAQDWSVFQCFQLLSTNTMLHWHLNLTATTTMLAIYLSCCLAVASFEVVPSADTKLTIKFPRCRCLRFTLKRMTGYKYSKVSNNFKTTHLSQKS